MRLLFVLQGEKTMKERGFLVILLSRGQWKRMGRRRQGAQQVAAVAMAGASPISFS